MSGPETDWRDQMRKEARRVHESVVTSSSTQFEYAKRWRRVDRMLSGLAAALTSIAEVSGLPQIVSAQVARPIAIVVAAAPVHFWAAGGCDE